MLLLRCCSSQYDSWHSHAKYVFQAYIKNNYLINRHVILAYMILVQLQTSTAVCKLPYGH